MQDVPDRSISHWLMLMGGVGGLVALLVLGQGGYHPGVPALMAGVGVFLAQLGYFSPMLVAKRRGHSNIAGITVVNLFLGWTLVGWVVALVWALSRNRAVELLEPAAQDADTSTKVMTRPCPFCAEEVRVQAVKCKHCGSDISATVPRWEG